MRAAVLERPRQFNVVEVPAPDPDAAQVRVRLQGCGVCASNLPPYEGRDWFAYPMGPGALGHEGWGVVDAIGSEVRTVAVGERVAMLSHAAYATHDLTTPDRLVKLPPQLDGMAVPGEPLACALNVFTRAHVEPGQTVAVIGIGFLGAVLVRLAALAGAEVIAISRRDSSLSLAERMGAHSCVRMDEHQRIVDIVSKRTAGSFCSCVIECVGTQWPLDLASAITGTRGRLVIAGYHQDGVRRVDMQLWNWRGIDVINAHEREDAVYVRSMTRAVALVASGTIDLDGLLTHRFTLDRINDALETARQRPEGFVKAVLQYE